VLRGRGLTFSKEKRGREKQKKGRGVKKARTLVLFVEVCRKLPINQDRASYLLCFY